MYNVDSGPWCTTTKRHQPVTTKYDIARGCWACRPAGCGMWQPMLGYCRPTGLCTAQRPQCCRRPLRRHRGRTCYRPATCHHIHWPFINHTRYTTNSLPQPCMVKVVRFPLRIPPTNLISLVSITTHTHWSAVAECSIENLHTILPFSGLSIISLIMFVGATSNR